MPPHDSVNSMPHTPPARIRELPPARPRRGRLGLWAVVAGLLVLLGGGLMFHGSPLGSRRPTPAAIFPGGNLAATSVTGNTGEQHLPAQRIDSIQLGQRLRGRNPIREQAERVEPDPATWRKISLYMTKESGLGLWIDLLRPLAWIDEHEAEPGGSIHLEMHEMGAVGDAKVLAIGPCPAIEPGDGGAVVIGRFKHQADANSGVVHLELEGQTEPTGVTDNHPYWSVDREEFVPVGQLRVGELVDTVFGLKHVASVTPITHDGFLYNLETTEHVYRVGSLGTLVHNTCVHRIIPDAQGRVRSAIAHITRTNLATGTATNSATRAAARAVGNIGDDAGHLIGRLLGGSGGKGSGNFFAQNPHINRGQFAQLEQQVANYVRNGDDVWIRVAPQYAGNSTRASSIIYQVRVNGQTIINQLFPN